MKNALLTSVTLLICGTMVACNPADYSGEYAPGCTAFAGDRISLDGDRFVWDKFTDQIKLDADGNRVDQFPAHPMSGQFQVDGERLVLDPDDDSATSIFYMVSNQGELYILNVAQHADWSKTGNMPECVLTRSSQ